MKQTGIIKILCGIRITWQRGQNVTTLGKLEYFTGGSDT